MISFRPMRHFRHCLCIAALLLASCSDQKPDASAWSPPQEVAKSSDSLSASFSLYRWNASLLTLGGDDGTYAVRIFQQDGSGWKTISTNNLGWLPSATDPQGSSLLIANATLLRHSVESQITIGSLASDGRFQSSASVPLLLQQTALFPNAPPNLEINESERPGHVGFSGGVMEALEIRVPYSITGEPVERKGHQVGIRGDLAVSANGVFATSDQGRSWRAEPIVVRQSQSPTMCRTEGFYYYFARTWLGGIPYELWYSRCALNDGLWSQPETLNKSGANELSEGLHAIGEKDVVHFCWLDARREKTRFSLNRPRAGNYEIAYRNRKDSDSKWSKDVILSKGHRWSYAPSMSVEGSNLVIAWAGASGWADRTEYGPSDIYYVTSKDSGKTWTKPIRVTHGANSEITSGRPQVALHKGVIHLFYIQGRLSYQQVSAGMVKLNQPPWPIYYQQRVFPP